MLLTTEQNDQGSSCGQPSSQMFREKVVYYEAMLSTFAQYNLAMESSESEVDCKMGSTHSKKVTPSVYYTPGKGVSLGSRPPSLEVNLEEPKEGIRLRPRKCHRQKSPSPASDKDSAIGVGGGSEMSQSMYSENSCNRDSFYSTAESGFDELAYMDDCRFGSKVSSSLKENHSPNSLKERNLNMLYRAHHGYDAGLNSIGHSVKPGLDTLSDCSSEKSGIVSSRSYRSSGGSSSRDVTVRSSGERYTSEFTSSRLSQISQDNHSLPSSKVLNPIENFPSGVSNISPKHLSTHSSPCHKVSPVGRGHPTQNRYSSDDQDYDPSLDASESLRSFNSSMDDIDWELDGRDHLSVLPETREQDPDIEFKKSLMNRIYQWSHFAEEYTKSRSPTPEIPLKIVRRSRSLDRHLGDPSSILVSDTADIVATTKPVEIEPTTEKNLESLEYELHDIQGEFESITSKLHELIENVHQPKSSKPHSSGSPAPARSKPRTIDCKLRTKWEQVPSSVCSDSEGRSSRASSVEYAWDLADYSDNHRHRSDSLVDCEPLFKDVGGNDMMKGFTQEVSVRNVFDPAIIADYVESEWRGHTDKAKTIREGYSKIPRLLSCHRMCVIRGDNYCALRSVLFQVLANGERVTQRWAGIIGIMDSLHKLFDDPTVALSSWTFANRLPKHSEDKLGSLYKCALSLYATIEEMSNILNREERERRIISILNTNETLDLELMEGMKVMMLLSMVELQELMADQDEVPVFAHLLFARDSSTTIRDFVKNHLNPVGDTGGIEQVELCLLGYALGVQVRVLRLSQCGQTDFDCCFPHDVPSDWPQVALVAEDDRHYNVPLP